MRNPNAAVELDENLGRVVQVDADLASLDEARPRLLIAIGKETSAIESFENEVISIALAAGFSTDEDPGDLCARIGTSLERAQEEERQRRDLASTLAEAESDLAAIIGSGSEADRKFAELASGDPDAWADERAALSASVVDAQYAYDAARDAEVEATRMLDALKSSSAVAELELECEALRTELDSVLKEWLRLGFASAFVSETMARYERERQPKVIAKATELFSLVTDGRYERLVAREDERSRDGITAVSSRGDQVDSSVLSRGTKEQLYLCLRLALAATHAEQTVPLPFVLDDVLVNFDPRRAAAVAAAIAETAREHQVLAFTCHPHIVELFSGAAPDCRIVELPTAV